MKQSLPAGPGTVTISVSLRDHWFELPEENGFVLGKLAVHGKHVSDIEIWAGSAGGKVLRWGLACNGWLLSSMHCFSLLPSLLRAKPQLHCRPTPACPFAQPYGGFTQTPVAKSGSPRVW